VEQLKNLLLSDHRRIIKPTEYQNAFNQDRNNSNQAIQNNQTKQNHHTDIGAVIRSKEQLSVLLNNRKVNRICLDLQDDNELKCALTECQNTGDQLIYVAFPDICRENKREIWTSRLALCRRYQINGILIRTYEMLQFLKEENYHEEIIADTSLYCMNDKAKDFLTESGCSSCMFPLELNERELWNRNKSQGSILVYGYFPVMHSAQCLLKTTGKCEHGQNQSMLYLKDRARKNLHVLTNCKLCYNTIYNSVPLSLHTELDKIKKMNFDTIWLSFTFEDQKTVLEVLEFYLATDKKMKQSVPDALLNYTKGHFSRGVE